MRVFTGLRALVALVVCVLMLGMGRPAAAQVFKHALAPDSSLQQAGIADWVNIQATSLNICPQLTGFYAEAGGEMGMEWQSTTDAGQVSYYDSFGAYVSSVTLAPADLNSICTVTAASPGLTGGWFKADFNGDTWTSGQYFWSRATETDAWITWTFNFPGGHVETWAKGLSGAPGIWSTATLAIYVQLVAEERLNSATYTLFAAPFYGPTWTFAW